MEVKMQNILTKALNYLGAALMTTLPASAVNAKEKIIQQEQISFEKCLKVITVSQDKLSIAPEISDVSDQKRVAVFTLVDGKLMIVCDGVEGNVTVSTIMD